MLLGCQARTFNTRTTKSHSKHHLLVFAKLPPRYSVPLTTNVSLPLGHTSHVCHKCSLHHDVVLQAV